ncbi:MAG: co-chaperone GroES [Bacillota bacterium]
MIKPLGKRVVLKKEETKNKTESGIILTEKKDEKPQIAKIYKVGPEVKNDNLKEDVKVAYKQFSGDTFELEEKEYIVVQEKDLLAIIE